ncbi:hypothetical protein BCR43DRAFT_472648 [Syncephalastrum racemosum]|uniref:RING-type domain-containing protein n=1 Tax=Syncephalastrum racemosum TaxID=13706 RepID=A0A1X2HF22_SYNRA|nr:hypothetical protein BCR43DRAFT_472648 [Syncephalastrum racemosum]
MMSDDEDLDCPLCMEEFDIADRNFRPCPCGYQICRFCWHHIKSNLNGRCPACRRIYTDQIVEFVPVSADEVIRLKREKKEKERQQRELKDSSRRHLSNVRVVQKNLVYVLGLPPKYTTTESDFFRKYGKVTKLVVSKRSAQQSSTNGPSLSGIYVTFARKEDAARAIADINGSNHDGRSVRASYGTTKYCTYYLRHMACPNPNCMYLHEPGDETDSYNKENPSVGNKHPSSSAGQQVYPNKRVVPSAGTAASATPSSSATTTTATTATATLKTPLRPSTSTDSQNARKGSPWAPIPKVVPPPPRPTSPPPAAAAAVAASSPAPSPSVPKQQRPKPVTTTPDMSPAKPIAIEKKPALPATASWGKGQNMASSCDSTITPDHFGPSLSDALSAQPKTKRSPTIPKKKDKKKTKMVRLEEFEESERAAKRASTAKPAETPEVKRSRQENPWQINMPPPQPATAPAPAPTSAAASAPENMDVDADRNDENEKEPAVVDEVMPAVDKKEADERDRAMDDVQVPKQDAEVSKEVPESETESAHVVPEATSHEEEAHEEPKESVDQQKLQGTTQEKDEEEEEEIREGPSEHEGADLVQSPVANTKTAEKPSFANYVLGNFDIDDVDDDFAEAMEGARGLSSLKDDDIFEFDPIDYSRERAQLEISEKVQDEHFDSKAALSQFDSPLEPLGSLSANFVHNDLDSPEQQRMAVARDDPLVQPRLRHFNDVPPPPHLEGRLSQGPPPGIGVPPDWHPPRFDPFNGQDPSLQRRLLHSQQMLEASGLFNGFPRPPPMFGFTPPDFRQGPPPQQPPPGIFPPPPQAAAPPAPPPPPGMMRANMMNLPPGLGAQQPSSMDSPEVADLGNDMQNMNLHRPPPPHPHHHHHRPSPSLRSPENPSVRSMQDDFRALLPNVNISFGPLGNEAPAPRTPPRMFASKPHTPASDDSALPRRISDSYSVNGPLPPQQPPQQQEPMPARLGDYFAPPSQDKVLFGHKPNEGETPGYPEPPRSDVKQEAQNFFGEFLRRAAASSAESPSSKEETNAHDRPPFHDPAIMSMRLSGAERPAQPGVRTETQNAFLQILDGRASQPQSQSQHQHQQQQQARPPDMSRFPMRSPDNGMGMFMHGPPPQQQRPPPPPMGFQDQGRFMPAFGEPQPPPMMQHHPRPMHDGPPPPGLMRPPPPPFAMQMQMEMGYRGPPQQQQQQQNGRMGNMPPGLFSG